MPTEQLDRVYIVSSKELGDEQEISVFKTMQSAKIFFKDSIEGYLKEMGLEDESIENYIQEVDGRNYFCFENHTWDLIESLLED